MIEPTSVEATSTENPIEPEPPREQESPAQAPPTQDSMGLFAWQVFLCVAIFLVLIFMHAMVQRTRVLMRDGGTQAGPAQPVQGGQGEMPHSSGVAPPGQVKGPRQPGQEPKPPPNLHPPQEGVETLPLGEILAGLNDLMKVPPSDRARVTPAQAKQLVPVVERGAKATANADGILQSGITKVYLVLTEQQKRFIEDHPSSAIRDVGDPSNPNGDPLGARLITLLEARAGVKANTLAPAVPVQPVAMATANPQTYREGLITLELLADAPRLTPQQARDLLPYIRDDVHINARQLQAAHAIVKLLTPLQRDRIMAMHTNATIRNVLPMVVLVELRSLAKGR